MAVEATTTINRRDYGVKLNQPMVEGGLMLDNDVLIELVQEAVSRSRETTATYPTLPR